MVLFAAALIVQVALVSCLSDQELAQFNVTSVTKDGANVVIKSTAVPNHVTGNFPNADNPNTIVKANHTMTVPLNPHMMDTPSCLPMGTIALAINGVPIFNPYQIDGYNAVEGEYKEVFDSCNGHPSPQGVYHYHMKPVCLDIEQPDKLVGVALDGYPIYGPVRGDGQRMNSSVLDECHGTTYLGSYRYYVTTEFPYILGCYRGTAGTVDQGVAAGGMGPPGGGGGGGGPPPSGGGAPGGGGGGNCYYAFDVEKGQLTYSNALMLKYDFVFIIANIVSLCLFMY